MTDQQWADVLLLALPPEERDAVTRVTVEQRDDWTDQPSLHVTVHLREVPEDYGGIWSIERAVQKRVWEEDEALWPYVFCVGPVPATAESGR
jgi:hypothetical protein